MEKQYTQDWFSRCIPTWELYLTPLKNQPGLSFLEVGSYEGKSTCWLVDNILTSDDSMITCVDLWVESAYQGKWNKELYDRYDMHTVLDNFNYNTEEYGHKVIAFNGKSQEVLRMFKLNTYDLAYIDGSHIACDVLEDIILSFRLVKNDGVLIFDDYTWDFFSNPLRHPKIAIDAFLDIYKGQYYLLYQDQQVIIKKCSPSID